MQSLPLKYRPETFEELAGQEINSRFLSSLITKGQIGRNVILYGPYGTSKTTSCRIYARALNCTSPTSTGSPCNTCENCSDFYAGTMADYSEVDGASQGQKAEIKELQDRAKSPPLQGKYRIINIDECQGLSKQAWDALLKLIEEPPPFLVFIFTTTEINKVREAIQSRCQVLEVKLLDSFTAKNHLKKICEKENFRFEEQALELIAYLSGGHPRDLLKNLEQVTFLGDVSLDNAKDIFNIGYIKHLVTFFKHLFSAKEPTPLLNVIREWHDTSSKKMDIMREFVLYLQYLNLFKSDVIINPVFEFIPKADKAKIWTDFVTYSENRMLEPERCWESLIKIFRTSVFSDVELNIFISDLFAFVHSHNFNSNNFEKPVVDAAPAQKKKVTNKKGRRFVGDYTEEKKSEPPPTEEPESKELYPHNLLQHGFTPTKKSDLKIIG